jgi:hypothetical protein
MFALLIYKKTAQEFLLFSVTLFLPIVIYPISLKSGKTKKDPEKQSQAYYLFPESKYSSLLLNYNTRHPK